jgi:hypothetical protein
MIIVNIIGQFLNVLRTTVTVLPGIGAPKRVLSTYPRIWLITVCAAGCAREVSQACTKNSIKVTRAFGLSASVTVQYIWISPSGRFVWRHYLRNSILNTQCEILGFLKHVHGTRTTCDIRMLVLWSTVRLFSIRVVTYSIKPTQRPQWDSVLVPFKLLFHFKRSQCDK